MPTINFFIQGNKNPTGIYVRVREGKSIDAKARTSFLINPEFWSINKRSLKHTKDDALKNLNKELQELKSEILNAFNMSVNKKNIDSLWLKSIVFPKNCSIIPSTLVEYFDFYHEKQRHSMVESSLKKMNAVKNFIIRFEKETRKKHLIIDVNEEFIQKYLEFGYKQGYKQNYLSRNFKFIKTICYDAESRGLSVDGKIRKLKIKEETISIVYLTKEEIELINNVFLKRAALSNARDWLIISCETAQRVSDFLGYKNENIRYQKNAKGIEIPFLDIIQKKTGSRITIPLSSRVLNILLKRKGHFPSKISAQKYNKYIKLVAREAGLTDLVDGSKYDILTKRKVTGVFPKWELVTSHIGRRSYASNNYGIIPTSLIMTMTGHKSEKEFLKYVGKSEASMALQLSEYIT